MRNSIVLHENQSKVYQDETPYRVVVAGRKWGKSTLALVELLRAARKAKNIVYIAPTYKMAKNTLWLDHIRKFVPDTLIANQHDTDLRLTMLNDSMITLYGADDPDRLRGLNIDFAVMDEMADIKKDVWEQIIEPNLLTTKGKAMFIGTPKGKKNHLFNLFERPGPTYKSWHFTSYESPLNDKAKLDAIEQRLAGQGKEDVWKQEYLAMFTVLAGMIYDNWDRKIHIAEPEIKDPVFGLSVDRGMEAPSAVGFYKLYRKEGEDRIHRYDEIYRPGLSPSELTEEIRNRIGKRDFVHQYCDPSAADFIAAANEKGLKIKPATKTKIGEPGHITTSSGPSWVREGISKCKGWLAKSPIDGKPKFTVSPNCKNFIDEIEGYIWEEDKDRPRKMLDHCMDEWRYFVVSFKKVEPLSKKSFKEIEAQFPKQRLFDKRGHY